MILADVMDELAVALRAVPTLQGRTYAYPVQSLDSPAAFVSFPERTFDLTFGRGMDEIDMAVVVVVATTDMRSARDRMLAYMDGDGVESIKAAIEDGTYAAFDSVRVTGVTVEEYFIGDVPYLAGVFPLNIIGSGTTS